MAKRILLYLHLSTKDNHNYKRAERGADSRLELLSAPRFEVLWAAVSLFMVSPLFPRRRRRQRRKRSLENRRFWKLRRCIPAPRPKIRRRNLYLGKTVNPLCAGGIAVRCETRRGAAATPALIPATKSDSAIPPNLLFAISSVSPHTGHICLFSRFLCSRPAPIRRQRSWSDLQAITAYAFSFPWSLSTS